jgi:1-acyl-sn-glycerol-3-phosphate acyltransferase
MQIGRRPLPYIIQNKPHACMILILRKLHSYLVAFNMCLFFALLFPPLYYASLKPERYGMMINLRRVWAFLSTFFAGIIFRFEYETPIDWSKPYVICPNPTSNLDTSMVSLLMKHQFSFMGKSELLDSPVTGIYFRTVDIPVNRESKMSSFRAYRAAEDKLKTGKSIIMFPEGGIADEYPPRLQAFKNGPFRLAIAQKVAIIPVSSVNTWKVFWDSGFKYGSRPGVCKIYVHKPISTSFLKASDADLLRDKVKDAFRDTEKM